MNDLYPELIPADYIASPTWLVCGKCNCSRLVEFYVYSTGSDPFEAVCDCPLEATLIA